MGVNGLAERREGTPDFCLSELIRALSGHGDDRRPWIHHPQRPDQLEPINVRHVKIRDDDVNAYSFEDVEGLHSIRGEMDLVARPLDNASQNHPIRLLVVDDEYTCHDGDPLSGPMRETGLVSGPM